jgi:hypothetical protein
VLRLSPAAASPLPSVDRNCFVVLALIDTPPHGFIVIRDGKLLYENYFNGYKRDSACYRERAALAVAASSNFSFGGLFWQQLGTTGLFSCVLILSVKDLTISEVN